MEVERKRKPPRENASEGAGVMEGGRDLERNAGCFFVNKKYDARYLTTFKLIAGLSGVCVLNQNHVLQLQRKHGLLFERPGPFFLKSRRRCGCHWLTFFQVLNVPRSKEPLLPHTVHLCEIMM